MCLKFSYEEVSKWPASISQLFPSVSKNTQAGHNLSQNGFPWSIHGKDKKNRSRHLRRWGVFGNQSKLAFINVFKLGLVVEPSCFHQAECDISSQDISVLRLYSIFWEYRSWSRKYLVSKKVTISISKIFGLKKSHGIGLKKFGLK